MKTWLIAILFGSAFWWVACGSSNSGVDTGGGATLPCNGSQCNDGDAGATGGSPGVDGTTLVIAHTVEDAGTTWSPLCGPINGGCLPDPDAGSCAEVNASDADGGADVTATADGGSDDAAPVELTCRIRPVADSSAIERACEGAGPGKSGDPCQTTVDCGSGLTCVAEDLAGLCRPYCCADPESCPSNSYCTTRSTLINRDPWVLGSDVPVCSVAENCPLTDPYPCPQDQNCTCPAGKACMVVRRQGLTACVKPGTGQQGDYCPCAAGYVCSNATFTCLKLCLLSQANAPNNQTSPDSPCTTGTSCQASNDVPPDWGVCSDVPLLIN